MTEEDPICRVLLVGFMGSGKTLVGRALARRLGWEFRDFDQEIRARVGLPIPKIFRQHGEKRFRKMEGEVGKRLLREEGVVLASGGGWPVEGARMRNLPPGTVSVWLRVSPEEAVRRVREDGPTRPLLAVDDPTARARELLASRERFYGQAHLDVDTEGRDPEKLARIIERLLNETGRELVSSR
jgi:shikimate kinase